MNATLRSMVRVFSLGVLVLPLAQGCDHERDLKGIEDRLGTVDASPPEQTGGIEPACAGSSCSACPPSCPASGQGSVSLPGDDCDAPRSPGAPETAAVDTGSALDTMTADAGSTPRIVGVNVGSTSAPSFSTLAVQLNGTSDYVRLADLAFETGSISMWIQTFDNGFLFSKATPAESTRGELRLDIVAGMLRLRIDPGDGNYPETRSNFDLVLNDGLWHHVLVTFNPGMHTFVDGLEQRMFVEAVDNVTGMVLTGVDIELGRNNAQRNSYYAGLIDEVAIFDSALDASQVTSVYNEGAPGDLLAPGSIPPPKHWWRLGEGDESPVVFDRIGSAHGTLMSAEASSASEGSSPKIQGCVAN